MVILTKDSGIKINDTAKEYLIGPTIINIKDLGLTIRSKVTANI